MKRYQRDNELGIRFETKGCVESEFELPIPGVFNVYNALTAIAICRHLPISLEQLIEALTHVCVKGRMEIV